MNKNESKGFDDTNIDNDFKPSKNKGVLDIDIPKFLKDVADTSNKNTRKEAKRWTLDEIIKNYSGKKIKVTVKENSREGNISIIGKIYGYETEADSEVGDDVIFLDIPYKKIVSEIKISDIINIELVQQKNYDNVKITHYNDNI